jgi:hypothetical protein
VTLGTDFRKTLWDSADLAAAVGFLIVWICLNSGLLMFVMYW